MLYILAVLRSNLYGATRSYLLASLFLRHTLYSRSYLATLFLRHTINTRSYLSATLLPPP